VATTLRGWGMAPSPQKDARKKRRGTSLDRWSRYPPRRIASRYAPKARGSAQAECPAVKDRQLRAMVEAAWAAGWWCEKTSNGHVQCYQWPVEGGGRGKIVTVANTPSDHRTIPNTRSTFRRAGLQL
jgi:hypothetical protein